MPHYLSGSNLVAVGVHGGQDVDARVVDEVHDPVVPGPVLLAEELAELDEQLAAEHLVAVHVAHVLELGLHWGREGGREGGCQQRGEGDGAVGGSVTFQRAPGPLGCTQSINKTGESIGWLSFFSVSSLHVDSLEPPG